MGTKLIILDRDGVINYDSDHYIKNEGEWIAIPGSLTAITKLNRAGYRVALASNQSGLARGYFDLGTLILIHKKMTYELAAVGGHIDAIEFCPDHPDRPTENRKPKPGMIIKLLKQFNAKASETWFVGDSDSDLACAYNSGCKPALVLTGKGQSTLENLTNKIPIFDDLSMFVEHLLNPASNGSS